MQINPFYAAGASPAAPALWHDNDVCNVGRNIAPASRCPGLGTNTTHCPCCAALNQPLRPCQPHVGVALGWAPDRNIVAKRAHPRRGAR